MNIAGRLQNVDLWKLGSMLVCGSLGAIVGIASAIITATIINTALGGFGGAIAAIGQKWVTPLCFFAPLLAGRWLLGRGGNDYMRYFANGMLVGAVLYAGRANPWVEEQLQYAGIMVANTATNLGGNLIDTLYGIVRHQLG